MSMKRVYKPSMRHPTIVSAKARIPAITSARSAITTIIGCGNALGTQIPPYFVFKGQRMNVDAAMWFDSRIHWHNVKNRMVKLSGVSGVLGGPLP